MFYNIMVVGKYSAATEFALLAQLDRASVYGTEGWGFELLTARQKAIKS